MKKIAIILLVCFSLSLIAQTENNQPSQDEMNKMFMFRLDVKLTQITKVLGAYNQSQKNMQDIKNLQYFNDFLYQMTLEIGKIRKLIIESESQNIQERENSTSIAISTLKSDVYYDFSTYVSESKDKENRIYLSKISGILHKKLDAIRKAIIASENEIAQTREITFLYMDFHSQEFLYSYILSVIDISSYLSFSDRDYLTTIVVSLQDEINKKIAD